MRTLARSVAYECARCGKEWVVRRPEPGQMEMCVCGGMGKAVGGMRRFQPGRPLPELMRFMSAGALFQVSSATAELLRGCGAKLTAVEESAQAEADPGPEPPEEPEEEKMQEKSAAPSAANADDYTVAIRGSLDSQKTGASFGDLCSWCKKGGAEIIWGALFRALEGLERAGEIAVEREGTRIKWVRRGAKWA